MPQMIEEIDGWSVTFLALDTTMRWHCEAPRHTFVVIFAEWVAMISRIDPTREHKLLVNQVFYVCGDCKTEMVASLG